jgi:hypothetical protein
LPDQLPGTSAVVIAFTGRHHETTNPAGFFSPMKGNTMSVQSKGAMLASAAGLLALSLGAFAADPPKGSKGVAIAANDKVHCYAVHDCKGNSDCKTTDQQCKGQNACKGQGFKAASAKECLDKGGTIGDLVEKKKS